MRNLTFVALVLLIGTPAQAQPSFDMGFAPDTIGPASSARLTLTFDNTSGAPASDLAVSLTLAAGVALANGVAPSTDCGDAIVDAPDGGDTLTVSGGRLGAGAVCTVSVNVTSAIVGNHTNITGDLTSSEGNSGPAVADLTVASDRPGFTLSATPSSVRYGATTTLTYTIDNTQNSAALESLNFSHVLPAGFELAAWPNASTDCGNALIPATLTAPASGDTVTLFASGSLPTFPVLAAGASCTVSVDVTVAAAGSHALQTGLLTAGFESAGYATELVEVEPLERVHLSAFFAGFPVAPGGTVDLDISIANTDRDFGATNIAFTDDLDATLTGLVATGLPLTDVCGVGSTVSGTGLLSFAGGTLAAGGRCSFTVTLQVPAGALPGIYVNTTSALAADIDGAGATFSGVTDELEVSPTPIVGLEFLGQPFGAGEDAVLQFTVTNTSPTFEATDVAVSVELTTVLPFPVSVALPPTPDPPCGPGSALTLVSPGTDRQSLSLTAGSIPAGGSCTFEVTITLPADQPGGTNTFVTEPATATIDGRTVTGPSTTVDLTVIAGPRLTLEFSPAAVAPGATVDVIYTLEVVGETAADATGVSFTHDLNVALPGLVATGLPLADLCGAGTATGSAGDTVVTIAGLDLSPGTPCSFSITLDVPGAAFPGEVVSTTSELSAQILGVVAAGPPGQASFWITGLEGGAQFIPAVTRPGTQLALQFTFENFDASRDATSISFVANLGGVLPGLVAVPPLPASPCGAGSTLTGTNSLSFAGGQLLAGQSCTFSVTVEVPAGAPLDQHVLATQSGFALVDGTPVLLAPITARFTLADPLGAVATFVEERGTPGGVVHLELTLSNSDATEAISSATFSVDLEAALAGLALTGATVTDCGASATVTGTSLVAFVGGDIAAGGQCIVELALQLPSSVSGASLLVVGSGQVQGLIGGLVTSAAGAVAEIPIHPITLTHAFADPVPQGGSTTVSYTLVNEDSAVGIGGMRMAHELDLVAAGVVATDLPRTDICGSGSAVTGTSRVELTGAALEAGGTCTFEVAVAIPLTVAVGDYPSETGPVSVAEVVSATSTDTLTVTPAVPLLSATFTPASIITGDASTLELFIDNRVSASAATDLAMTDMLPLGLVLASPSNAATTCGGTLTDGLAGFTLAGGTVAASGTCVVTLDVTGSDGGTYTYTPGEMTSSAGTSVATGAATLEVTERDTDGDGVIDDDDTDIADPNVCADADSDTCDDCSVTGADGSGGDPANDGPDQDSDGVCDATDPDYVPPGPGGGDPDDEGCGCRGSRRGASMPWLALVGLMLRRRRAARRG